MAEAVGPSRVKHRADEARACEERTGRGSSECASAIHFQSDHRFCCKVHPVRVLVHTYEYIVQVPVHTYIPRDEYALQTRFCIYLY